MQTHEFRTTSTCTNTGMMFIYKQRGLPFSMYAPRGGGGGRSSLLYISIAYYMQKGGGWVQIACKSAYVLNGRPQRHNDVRRIYNRRTRAAEMFAFVRERYNCMKYRHSRYYKDSFLWDTLPHTARNSETLLEFKKNI